jgi:hypothetical protein
MQFLLSLFRARQQDWPLISQAFTDAQRSDIAHGRMPLAAL